MPISMTAGALLVATVLAPASAQPEREPVPPEVTARRGEVYGSLMRALFAARQGDASLAVDEIRRAVELQPDSADLQVEAAELLLSMGRRAEAEHAARRALELVQEHPQAIRFLAERAVERALGPEKDEGSLHEAIRLFERLEAAESPVDSEVLQMLARLRLEAKDLNGAIQAMRRLVRERPGDRTSHRMLAQMLLRADQETEALRVLLRFLALHPADEDLLGFAEQLARNLNAWEIVDQELQQALAPTQGTGAASLKRLWGEARLRLGRVTAAVELLEQAHAAAPQDRAVATLLGRAYRGMRRLARAAELFDQLTGTEPQDAEARLELAQTLEEQRDAQGALDSYETALELIAPHDRSGELRDHIRRRIASLHIGNKRSHEAAAILSQLEQAEHPEALELRVRLAIEERDWELARRLAGRLRSVEQVGLGALLEGEIAVLEKRWQKARVKFSEAITQLGPAARRRIAALYLESGRPDSGAAALREWVEQAPDNADARFYLGDLLYQAKHFEEAEVELREAFRLDPQHGPALNYLGYSLAERNERLKEALDLVQRALEHDTWNGLYLDSLGWVYYRMGRYDEAREPLERAALELPKDPTVLEHLGDVYLSLGERQLAVAAWNRALAAAPRDADALRSKIAREARSGAAPSTSSLEPGPSFEESLEVVPPRPR